MRAPCATRASRRCAARPASSNSSATDVSRSSMSLSENVVDLHDEVVLLVRLADVAIDADIESALAMLIAGTRRDHDDRHAGEAFVGLHLRCQLIAVHARHFD